jgi:hypothetical protein
MGLDEILDRVALGRLITVVGSAAADRPTREVMAVPVADVPPTTLALGWLPQASRPEFLSFARSLQCIAADRGGTRGSARWHRKHHARHWSRWRHCHQQRARRCHYQRQQLQDH